MLRELETSFASISQLSALTFSRLNSNDLYWKETFSGENFQYAGHPNPTNREKMGFKSKKESLKRATCKAYGLGTSV